VVLGEPDGVEADGLGVDSLGDRLAVAVALGLALPPLDGMEKPKPHARAPQTAVRDIAASRLAHVATRWRRDVDRCERARL
jgi:hypothetical protein